MKKGTDVTIMTIVSGSRKNAWPKTSMPSRQRFGSMLLMMSMRMCSLERRVHGEHRRNIVPNSTHCSSSQAFDEVSNTFLIVALVAETITTIRISQDKTLPIRNLPGSRARLSLTNPPPSFPHCISWEGSPNRRCRLLLLAPTAPPPGHPNLPRPLRGRQLVKRTTHGRQQPAFAV